MFNLVICVAMQNFDCNNPAERDVRGVQHIWWRGQLHTVCVGIAEGMWPVGELDGDVNIKWEMDW